MGAAMRYVGRVRRQLWRDGTDCAMGRSGLERVVSAIGEFFCCGGKCTYLDGRSLCLWLTVAGHVEHSSREYEYMANVIDGTERSALKARLRNLPSWPRRERHLGRRNNLSGVYQMLSTMGH